MKMDLHVHTAYSQDAHDSPRDIARYLKKKGFEGMAITDHNSIRGVRKIRQNPPKDFLILPGCEISTARGHIIALGIDDPITKGLAIRETIEKIHEQGGIAIIPHPFRVFTGIGKNVYDAEAIETFNGRNFYWGNIRAEKLANQLSLGKTGGSDAHSLQEAGKGYTLFDDATTIDDALTEIEKKKTKAGGDLQIPFKYPFHLLVAYGKRGFKRI
jgi:predicted metal-dependent phosphoesterase TrpH